MLVSVNMCLLMCLSVNVSVFTRVSVIQVCPKCPVFKSVMSVRYLRVPTGQVEEDYGFDAVIIYVTEQTLIHSSITTS